MVKVLGDIPWLQDGSTASAIVKDAASRKLNTGYGVYPHLNTDEPRPQRTVACRGTELFVAKDNEIRCLNLQVIKATAEEETEEKSYKTLNLPEVTFEIRQLEISEDGAFLAIIGDSRIGICLLPSRELIKSTPSPLKTRYWDIGPTYHDESASTIVRALWHPYAEGGCLVVLTSDGYLRLYDLVIQDPLSFHHPDQTLDLLKLAGRSRASSSFSPDALDFEPASCTFADGSELWKPFTLYILMRGGDIYGICPLVPARWYFPTAGFLDELKAELDLKREDLSLKEKPSKLEKVILRQEIKWVNDIFEQVRKRENSPDYTMKSRRQEFYTRPKSFDSTPRLQGPYLLKPEPDFVDAYGCDIFHNYTSAATLLGIAWSNGRMDICIEPEMLEPRFELEKKFLSDGEDDDGLPLPIANPHESIQVKFDTATPPDQATWPVFLKDSQQNTSIFVYASGGILSIDMSDWLEKLKTLSQADVNEHYLARELEEVSSSVISRITPQHCSSLTGAVGITNPYIGYVLVAFAKETMYAYELEYSGTIKDYVEDALAEAATTANEETKKHTVPVYKPLVKIPLFEPPPILTGPPLLAQVRAKYGQHPAFTQPLHTSTGTLKVLRNSQVLLEHEFSSLRPVIEELYERARLQHEEFHLQIRKAQDLNEKVAKMKSSNVKERLQKALAKQNQLKERADELLRKAVLYGSPALSDAEKKWIDEVHRVEAKVSGPNGYSSKIKRMNALTEQLVASVGEENQQELADVLQELKVNPEYRKGTLQSLSELLTKENQLVDNTKEKIRDLEKAINALEL